MVTEVRPVQGFTAVSVSGGGNLIIEQTGVESLEITAEDNILPIIQSEVTDGRLDLRPAPGTSFNTSVRVQYRLTVRDLTEIDASGVSQVEASGLDTKVLITRLSGVSSLTATGVASDHELDISGVSRCDAPELQSRDVTAVLSGASSALVRVSDTLTVTASGASSLQYLGDPVVESSISGGSSVSRAVP